MMRSIRWLGALLALAALAQMSLGQESGGRGEGQQQSPTPPPASEQGREPATPPPSGAQRPRPADDVFIPTEELAADEEVTFPVDI